MVFALMDDRHADDPMWPTLVEHHSSARTPAQRLAALDAIEATWARMNTEAGRFNVDGYLTEGQALKCARDRAWIIDALTKSVLGRPPRLHRPGDECKCLGDGEWKQHHAYRVHKFLKRNRSRARVTLDRAQAADLRNPTLKHAVAERDGWTCRYCRSGPLSAKAVRARDRRRILTYDHVDPTQPAGEHGENLAVACARCNEFKGHRTPDEADMRLLPVPTPAEIARWRTDGMVLRDLHLIDRSAPAITDTITDKPPTDHRIDGDRTVGDDERPPDRHHDKPTPPPVPAGDPEPRPKHATGTPDHPRDSAGKGPGRDGYSHTPHRTDGDDSPPPDQPASHPCPLDCGNPTDDPDGDRPCPTCWDSM
ncbi:HNH endonuclease [Actinokineospora spheciospongiae]|uniref:HNH endonuclease n=1 Tax=Actinokineospora spheciospongiae TaxID=909613 RepID=UPI000D70A474|nr:hypothetical protein [Actinokineospora spheciospongiae]PWW50251.1 hypothetical protein DFQ13_12313 [Actinokineospora spheciospongiae]